MNKRMVVLLNTGTEILFTTDFSTCELKKSILRFSLKLIKTSCHLFEPKSLVMFAKIN